MLTLRGTDAFIRSLQRYQLLLRELPPAEVRSTALALYDRIVELTPVRTGRARDGWELLFPTPLRAIIRNLVPYVQYLETGTDKMRAYSMVGQALAEYVNGLLPRRTR